MEHMEHIPGKEIVACPQQVFEDLLEVTQGRCIRSAYRPAATQEIDDRRRFPLPKS